MRVAGMVSVLLLAASLLGALTPSTCLVVPAAARGPGAGTSTWRMDLYLVNPEGGSATARLYWLERDLDNSAAAPVTVVVPSRQTVVLEDVIRTRFGRDAASGAIRIEADRPIAATSRIYNLMGGVTFGQGFDGLCSGANAVAGSEVRLAGMRQDGGSRSNLFATAGPGGASFSVEVRSPGGARLGSASWSVPPWSAFYAPLTGLVPGSPGDLMLVVSVTAGSAWFAGSRIDQATGDPFTVAAVVADRSLLRYAELEGSYFGVWGQDTFDEVNGDARMTVDVDERAGTATVSMDFDGPLLGGRDPGPVTLTGPFGPGGGSLQGTSDDFGPVSLEIDAHGRCVWAAASVPDPVIVRIDSVGTITTDQLLASFTVTLDGMLPLWGGMALVRLD